MQTFGRLLAVTLGVVILAFVLTRLLPGDPVSMLGVSPGMGPEELQELRAAAGLEHSLAAQFLGYVGDVLRGDLGHSVSTGNPVTSEILLRLPASLELALAGFLVALFLVLASGLAIARAPGGGVDRGVRLVIALGAALPLFVAGLLLIHIFYVKAGLSVAPIGRYPALAPPPRALSGLLLLDALLAGDWRAFRGAAAHLALPATTLAIFALAPMLRVFRAALLAALNGPGVYGARSLGFSARVVLWRYALPEALGPLVPVALLTFGYMLGAGVLVEKVFAWPGVGRYALDALGVLDYPPVQGVMLILALIHVGLAVLAEGIGRWLDPRVGLRDG